MRELTIRPRIEEFELNMLEKVFEKPISAIVRAFLQKYAGLGVYERIYIDKNNVEWRISQFNQFKDLHGLAEEFIKAGWGKHLAFAYDDGGWHFCLCMDDNNFGAIFINRWTDHQPEEQFIKIADSFEEIICALKRDPDLN